MNWNASRVLPCFPISTADLSVSTSMPSRFGSREPTTTWALNPMWPSSVFTKPTISTSWGRASPCAAGRGARATTDSPRSTAASSAASAASWSRSSSGTSSERTGAGRTGAGRSGPRRRRRSSGAPGGGPWAARRAAARWVRLGWPLGGQAAVLDRGLDLLLAHVHADLHLPATEEKARLLRLHDLEIDLAAVQAQLLDGTIDGFLLVAALELLDDRRHGFRLLRRARPAPGSWSSSSASG